jgi:opacity protein-like surface antigen
MKKALCVFLGLLVMTAGAWAKDIEAGTLSISGSSGLDFLTSTSDAGAVGEIDTDQWGIDVNFEYYLMPNLGIGMIIMYSDTDTDAEIMTPAGMQKSSSSLTEIMIGPQVVYNISVGEVTSVPVFAGVGYVSVDDGEDHTGWGWVLGAGVRRWLSDNISVDCYGYYSSISVDNGVDTDIDDLTVQIGLSVYLGGE